MRRVRLLALGVCMVAGQISCSSDPRTGSATAGNGSANPINLSNAGGSAVARPSLPVTITPNGDGTCQIAVGDGACAGSAFETENTPLDIYVMMDQTGSMCTCVDPEKNGNDCPDPCCNQTRIQAIRSAMSLFLRDPRSTGIGVGLGFFGQLSLGQISCDPATYAEPSVTVDLLPAHADRLLSSLNDAVPTGETPTGAAIRGACRYAREWQAGHPSHKVVVLLLTDGLPEAPIGCQTGTETCCPTLADAVSAAGECWTGKPGVATYVLGVGPYLTHLEQIAVAGGSSRAYLVGSGNVSADVLDALNQIRGDASIPCELNLPAPPAGQILALDQVNIVYADAACQGTAFYRVEDASRCTDAGGWYYDDRVAPQKIRLCPASCAQVSAPVGSLMYSVGCQTVTYVE